MIVVTGGAGFIGSNLINTLNQQGFNNIIVVDDLTNGEKFSNLVDCHIVDYLDKQEFLVALCNESSFLSQIKTVFHQGACSDTTCWDGKQMLADNFSYSKEIFKFCVNQKASLIYASSAAIYGKENFSLDVSNEKPLNVYGYSKYLFDCFVRQHLHNISSQVVGLRYFNVYGPKESHKQSMASTAYHFYKQLKQQNVLKLFGGYDGYAAGMQSRDFVYVADVARVNTWFMQHPNVKGIFNVGTGVSNTFNAMAQAVMQYFNRGSMEYINFPEHLKSRYQSFTQADISSLRAVGYNAAFTSLQEGVNQYMRYLENGD